MNADEGMPYLHCPVCDFSLDEREQGIGVCDNCGRVLSADEVAELRDKRANSEARGRRVVSAQRLAAFLGAIMMLIGMALYYTHYSPFLLIVRGRYVVGALTVVAVIYQRVHRDPMYVVLLPAGLFWLAMGLLAWAYS